MTRKTRPAEQPNSTSSEGQKMVNNYAGAGQNNMREMGGKRAGMQVEPPNELAPHIQRATTGLSQNALPPQLPPDYANPDFKLLEARITQKIQVMQQHFAQQLHESEERIYNKIFECVDWGKKQTEMNLASARNDIINSVCGDADEGFEVTQPMEDHNSIRRPPQRTPMRRTGTPLWAGNMPRTDTFSPQTREGYVPNAVSRTMSMPQAFVQASPFRSFTGGLDSMIGTPSLSGVQSQPLPGSVKRRLKTETSQLGTPGPGSQSQSQGGSQNVEIPKYKLSRAIKTVPDLWQEWTVGFQGGPSVKQLEDLYKSSWRNGMAERQFFSRRKVVIDEICKRGDEMYQEALKKREARRQYLQATAESNPGSLQELQSLQDDSSLWNDCHVKAAESLERERGRMSLNALSGKLRKEKNLERGISGSFSQDADGNHEDDDGDEHDEDGTQMTDTQYTDNGASQNPNSRHHDLMDIEHEQNSQHQQPQQRKPQQHSQANQRQSQSRQNQAPVAPMVHGGPQDDSLGGMARDVISMPHNHQVRPGSGTSTNGSSEEEPTQLQVGGGGAGDDNGLDDHFHTFDGFVEVEGMEKVGEMEEHVGKKRRVE